MNYRKVFNSCLIVLAVILLALTATSRFLIESPSAKAQLHDGSVKFVSFSISQVLGLTPGQKLRISLGTVSGFRGGDIAWAFRVSDSANQVLFESDPLRVHPGEWRHQTILLGDLSVVGEVGTGRAQVLVQLAIKAPRGSTTSDFVGSLEVLDEQGRTLLSYPPTIGFNSSFTFDFDPG